MDSLIDTSDEVNGDYAPALNDSGIRSEAMPTRGPTDLSHGPNLGLNNPVPGSG